MKKRSGFATNTALLTGASLLMRGIGMVFQAWLVGRIGSAGIGLYQLVLSVSGLMAAFAVSGISFATTRLISEELGSDNCSAIRSAMRPCLGYGLLFGLSAGLALSLLAEPIGFLWIGDARTVSSLRLSGLSMPCIALCSCLSGYFTAVGRIWKPCLVHLLEQLTGIGLVAVFLNAAPRGNLEASCAAVTLGRCLSDLLSLGLMLLVYRHDRRSHYLDTHCGSRLTVRMLRIALPLAVSAYARSALSTLQHLLVPRGLRAAGYTADGALSGYGCIQGMALPVIFFPACLISAAAELIVPSLTEAQVQQDSRGIRTQVGRLLRLGALYSVLVGAFLFVSAQPLGMLLYRSREAGRYIRLLAPLVPIMYTDLCLDGCLKGLGQQIWVMGINIVDALSSLLLVWWLLPRYALPAYLGIIYLTESLNFLLSVLRLRRILRNS